MSVAALVRVNPDSYLDNFSSSREILSSLPNCNILNVVKMFIGGNFQSISGHFVNFLLLGIFKIEYNLKM